MKKKKTEILYFNRERAAFLQSESERGGSGHKSTNTFSGRLFDFEYPACNRNRFSALNMSGQGTGKERSIDLQLTGRLLRLRLRRAGLSVRQAQKVLGLECPQSMYRWFSGQALPSVENLYILHRLLGCNMENLLVTGDRPLMVRCAAYLTAM